MKSYTDIEQSKKLAEILPIESADMEFMFLKKDNSMVSNVPFIKDGYEEHDCSYNIIPCWSLAALLNILHFRQNDIPSLSGGGYKDGNYTSDWCLDYEYDNGNYQKTFADNPIDVCYEMILELHEQKLL